MMKLSEESLCSMGHAPVCQLPGPNCGVRTALRIKGAAENEDYFGIALAAADLGRNRHADLAIGVHRETIREVVSGAVNIIYGSAGGLRSSGDQFWTLDDPEILGDLDSGGADFGHSLFVGNFGKSGTADLAIGAPWESIDTIFEGGAVHAIYGSSKGLISSGNQLWNQDSPGVLGAAEAEGGFGVRLVAAP